ncbi:MAG: SCO family protein [Gemmatimonadaceae bacterium]|nr:SCO family protein [Gemmatimonadaceae bacterium]
MRRGTPALAALALIILITAAWWALALWPLTAEAPEWLARTRYVCFGASIGGLPDAGGWILLIGQPLGMVLLLLMVWGGDARAGMSRLLERTTGQITVGVISAVLVAAVGSVVLRVREVNAEPFDPNPAASLAQQLTRINDVPPALSLVNQSGDTVRLDRYHGRAVLVTFAFAHCETVCPLVVNDVLSARDRIAATDPVRTPAVIVVTLDPFRDTPSRLPAIAKQWGLSGDAHVLSGSIEDVERTLSKWRIPRIRNERTGDFSHPTMVYAIGPNGRITYVVTGGSDQIVAAVRAL